MYWLLPIVCHWGQLPFGQKLHHSHIVKGISFVPFMCLAHPKRYNTLLLGAPYNKIHIISNAFIRWWSSSNDVIMTNQAPPARFCLLPSPRKQVWKERWNEVDSTSSRNRRELVTKIDVNKILFGKIYNFCFSGHS